MRQGFFRKLSRKKYGKAFSLIELSILITVISVVIAGFLSVSISRVATNKASSSNNNIDAIYQALGKYLVANKKLPCPAPITDIKSSTSTYGVAASASDCVSAGVYLGATNLVYGMIPTKTLGLASSVAEDAYGNKIVYVVDKRLTTTTSDSFENYVGASTIIQISGASVSNALFVIMSRGANQSGAYAANSASPSASVSAESSNDLSSVNDAVSPPTSTFDDTFLASSGSSDFDDVVFYKTRDQMLDDFNAWSLIPCAATSTAAESPATASTYCTNTSIAWPKSYAGQIAVSTTACPSGWTAGPTYPAKKCGAKGVWETSISTPCVAVNEAAAVCYVGYCQRTATRYGSAPYGYAYDASPDSSWVASGASITLTCDSGYGKNIVGGSRSVDYLTDMFGHKSAEENMCNPPLWPSLTVYGNIYFTTTDRTSSSPSVTCNSGTWDTSVSNACQACRDSDPIISNYSGSSYFYNVEDYPTSYHRNISWCGHTRNFDTNLFSSSCVSNGNNTYTCTASDHEQADNNVSGPARCEHSGDMNATWTISTWDNQTGVILTSSNCSGYCPQREKTTSVYYLNLRLLEGIIYSVRLKKFARSNSKSPNLFQGSDD